MDNNKNTQVFEIRVIAKDKLTEYEMWLCANDFMMRLEGYTTECPKELIDADIKLMPIIE